MVRTLRHRNIYTKHNQAKPNTIRYQGGWTRTAAAGLGHLRLKRLLVDVWLSLKVAAWGSQPGDSRAGRLTIGALDQDRRSGTGTVSL